MKAVRPGRRIAFVPPLARADELICMLLDELDPRLSTVRRTSPIVTWDLKHTHNSCSRGGVEPNR
jgi:hypothetical protein